MTNYKTGLSKQVTKLMLTVLTYKLMS